MDPDRAHLRSLARCARFAPQYAGRPILDEWLSERVDEALDELIAEESGRTRPLQLEDPARESASGGVFATFAKPLGLDPAQLRGQCAAFNAVPVDERRMLFAICVDHVSLEGLAKREGLTPGRAARMARRALCILMGADPASLPVQARERSPGRSRRGGRLGHGPRLEAGSQ